MIYSNAAQLIGNTPLLHAERFERACGLGATLLVKLESRNPGGSAKDRIALGMIVAAEQRGELCPGATLIEATSGNTGVGLGVVAAARGYRVLLTMPDSMSLERRKILSALGVEIVLTEGARGMAGANDKAEELLRSIPGSMRLLQFENPDNPAAHEATTGPEIWRDTEGRVDALVAGVGTGGTITGAGRYLKRHNPAIRTVAVQPAESPVLTGGKAAAHGIQGIGANFVPENFDRAVVDEILSVFTQDAIETARLFMKSEGILCGISGGAALSGAITAARRADMDGKTIVVILPDTGERYLSTPLFD
ncbi:MAG: cysteine synthase A [Clostridiales bacterium]|nr:cysteine synthase A [Clostridiales bacterium]